MTDDGITWNDIANYGAWAQVITRDFTTQTHIVPQFDDEGGWVNMPIVQVFPARAWEDWSEESLLSAKRFDAFMEREYARAEKERERKARDLLDAKRLLGDIFGDEGAGL